MNDEPPATQSPSAAPERATSSGGVDIRTGDAGQISAGGDIVGGDKVTNYLQLDVEKLVGILRQAMPDDPAPEHLQQALHDFGRFHARLFEWKELHNYLNDVIYVVDQYAREVERMDASGQPGDVRALRRLWRPVAQKVDLLLDWATSLEHIEVRFVRLDDGAMQGPQWAVELQAARARLDELLDPQGYDGAALYEATYDFSDVAERHMYLADKQLRDTAGELYNLSRIVLGSVGVE